MKELNLEEKAKAYDKVLKEVKDFFEGRTKMYSDVTQTLEFLFPELKESEDEKIRKQILSFLKTFGRDHCRTLDFSSWIAWLEKQGECVIDCHQNHQDSNRPSGGIVLEDFNGGEGFYKLNLAYLNKKQVEEVEEMVREWNNEPTASEEDIKDCIGLCLTDADEQRFKNYHTNLRDCLAWLEKQGEQKPTDTIESRFKIGDCITCNKFNTALILDIENGKYFAEFVDGSKGFHDIDYIDNRFHLWTIQDAKDGDVLAAHECNVIFKEIDGLNIRCHCAYHYLGYNSSFYIDTLQNKTAFHPATKEQRELLFQKMKEAGYEWDAEKKELKKIEI